MFEHIYSSDHIECISRNRDSIYGISILLVILYHLSCTGDFIYSPFSYGFIGVDMFLMLGGYGLCFSYSKNNLVTFYKRRIFRILPVYVLYNLLFALTAWQLHDAPLSISDFIYNITTLSFYGFGTWGIGNKCFDWFTASILLLYGLFPILLWLARKTGTITFLVLCIFAIFYKHFVSPIPWRIDCLVSRLPVFYFGILIYLRQTENFSLKWPIILSIMFLYIGLLFSSYFFHTAMIAPFLVLLLSLLLEGYNGSVKKVLSSIGRNSYELMVANSWSQQWSVLFLHGRLVYLLCAIVYHIIAIIPYVAIRRIVKIYE